MHYNISFPQPLQHFMEVTTNIKTDHKTSLSLYLPIWRPGRYEATYYAKNIKNFRITDDQGNQVRYTKTSHSSWVVDTQNLKEINVTYKYWAYKMDAGNSYFDEDLIYINFINCLIYTKESINEACEVALDIPSHYNIACGLKRKNGVLVAKDYYELVDSPMIASADLEHFNYTIDNTDFHIWINGKHNINTAKMEDHFYKFSKKQIEIMGEFPEDSYHFLLHLLPYKFYHGVEHHDSTVITVGPGISDDETELYNQLLGVSSHELFHAWNIIKIRPKELQPYDFNKEVTFPTGYVAEGFTTYYGDLFLAKSGVFSRDGYFNELNLLFKRHFTNFGRLNYSVVDSSIDLWVDGYALNFPDRKSSIYVEGAMIALCLDLMLRRKSEDKYSLDNIMVSLWENFGKTSTGYTSQDVQKLCEELYGESLEDFFNTHVHGTAPKDKLINELLQHVGCELTNSDAKNPFERYFGVKISPNPTPNTNPKIVHIAPGSIGEQYFSVNDEIISVNKEPLDLENIAKYTAGEYVFEISRNFNKKLNIAVKTSEKTYFTQYKIHPKANATEEQKTSFKSWTGLDLF
ncbi:M61 family metallopeptidase [Fulvivirga sediminis]|uniref:M61 family metallopeptidase n=1 Tax=Fulvivirga sediminis TaxID=2803949 RepID=A0A937FE36_9BACT|nr:M61 family metallopeptidase [Fulvivirga sediminis]MBL3659074.1 M61 family metallopeptidase [Fulvivirga sediminis]